MGRGPGKQRRWGMVKKRGKQIVPALNRKQHGRWRRQGEGAGMRHAKRTVLKVVQRRADRRLFRGNYASAIVPTTSLEIHRLPRAEQISIIFDGPAILDKAWETEGASALSKIAQHANQICSYFLPSIFTMPQITASADGC